MVVSYFKNNNILIDWFVRSNILFWNLFVNVRFGLCVICKITLYFIGFCFVNDKVKDKRNSEMYYYGRRIEFYEDREI